MQNKNILWKIGTCFISKVFLYIYDLEFNHKEYFDALLNSYTKKKIKMPLKFRLKCISQLLILFPYFYLDQIGRTSKVLPEMVHP